MFGLLLLFGIISCGEPKRPETTLSNKKNDDIYQKNSNHNDYTPGIASSFTITSILCNDEQGPDCTKLPLGDDYLTTVLACLELNLSWVISPVVITKSG